MTIITRRPSSSLKGSFIRETSRPVPRGPKSGSILAVKPGTGEIKWKFETLSPPTSGMATAGGLAYRDREGYLISLDAYPGALLWKYQTAGLIGASPISYQFNSRQYLAVAAGGSVMTFRLFEDAE